MNVPDTYSPLETMQKLLPILSENLDLTSEDMLQIASQELSPTVLERSPLERMEEIFGILERCSIAQRNKV